ncbi:type II toxin-antitoxin system HigB family toxin [Cedecea davisae]|nr:type II toxin-antitoxin system HigB family toxin [Cedecea davisae]
MTQNVGYTAYCEEVQNIARNKIRLITLIFFTRQKFYVRHIITHSEYM